MDKEKLNDQNLDQVGGGLGLREEELADALRLAQVGMTNPLREPVLADPIPPRKIRRSSAGPRRMILRGRQCLNMTKDKGLPQNSFYFEAVPFI